jgi:hypothetical protein
MDTNTTPTATTTTTTTATTASWRVRDTAEQLLAARRNIVSVDSTTTLSASNKHSTNSKKMHLSSIQDMHVPTQTCLARIQRDKAVTVQIAFSAAGQAVMKALQSPEYTVTASTSISVAENNITSQQQQIPSSVQQWQQLQAMRQQSLERSHENKEYTKKKGAKVDVDLMVHHHQHELHQHELQQQQEQDEQQREHQKDTTELLDDNQEPDSTPSTTTKQRSNSNISSASRDSSKKQHSAAAAAQKPALLLLPAAVRPIIPNSPATRPPLPPPPWIFASTVPELFCVRPATWPLRP